MSTEGDDVTGFTTVEAKPLNLGWCSAGVKRIWVVSVGGAVAEWVRGTFAGCLG